MEEFFFGKKNYDKNNDTNYEESYEKEFVDRDDSTGVGALLFFSKRFSNILLKMQKICGYSYVSLSLLAFYISLDSPGIWAQGE